MREINCRRCGESIPEDQPVFIGNLWSAHVGFCESCRGHAIFLDKRARECGVNPEQRFASEWDLSKPEGKELVRWKTLSCDCCGRLVVKTPRAYQRVETSRALDWVDSVRVFCSSACKSDHYRKRKEVADTACHQCGETFQAKRSDAKFCSTRCRVANHRAA